MNQIDFESNEIDFSLAKSQRFREWLLLLAKLHSKEIRQLTYIFCSDEFLLKMNQEHLSHDYYTDILTFDYRNSDTEPILGEIFISVDRVRENATDYGIDFEVELARVLAHGLLHLIGFNDIEELEELQMRNEEEKAISLLFHVEQ